MASGWSAGSMTVSLHCSARSMGWDQTNVIVSPAKFRARFTSTIAGPAVEVATLSTVDAAPFFIASKAAAALFLLSSDSVASCSALSVRASIASTVSTSSSESEEDEPDDEFALGRFRLFPFDFGSGSWKSASPSSSELSAALANVDMKSGDVMYWLQTKDQDKGVFHVEVEASSRK